METPKQFFIDNNVRPKDIITLENVTKYCKKAKGTVLEFIETYNRSKKLFFDTGWILFQELIQNGDKIFYVTGMFSKHSHDDIIARLVELVKNSGYDKIKFETRRDMNVWKKKMSRYVSLENDISIASTITCDLEGV